MDVQDCISGEDDQDRKNAYVQPERENHGQVSYARCAPEILLSDNGLTIEERS